MGLGVSYVHNPRMDTVVDLRCASLALHCPHCSPLHHLDLGLDLGLGFGFGFGFGFAVKRSQIFGAACLLQGTRSDLTSHTDALTLGGL